MSRKFDEKIFSIKYNQIIIDGVLNEVPTYYSIYKKRYLTIFKRYCELSKDHLNQKVLDIGGGQYALLTHTIFGDDATTADVVENSFDYLRKNGIKTIKWNIAFDPAPIQDQFDVIFLSEVIHMVPVPAYIVLEKLFNFLNPGGYLICSTPNFFRIRNVLYLLIGKEFYDYFRYSDKNTGAMYEYSKEHLEWQFRRAGFENIKTELLQLHNSRTKPLHRVIAFLGSPIYFIPRFRDNILVVAQK